MVVAESDRPRDAMNDETDSTSRRLEPFAFALVLSAASTTSACAHRVADRAESSARDAVRTLAEYDLQCSSDAIDITPEWGNRSQSESSPPPYYRAVGCGVRAQYSCTPLGMGGEAECTVDWIYSVCGGERRGTESE